MNVPDHVLLAGLPELSNEEKHQRTLEGLADVDAGRTILHEEMLEWARSLFDRPNGLTRGNLSLARYRRPSLALTYSNRLVRAEE